IKHIITTGEISKIINDLESLTTYNLFLYDFVVNYHFINLDKNEVISSNRLNELTNELDSFYFIPTEVIQEYLDSFKEVKVIDIDINLDDLKLDIKDFLEKRYEKMFNDA